MCRNTENIIDLKKVRDDREETQYLEELIDNFVDEAGEDLPGTFHAYPIEGDLIKIVAVVPKGVDPKKFINESIPDGFFDDFTVVDDSF